jgi:hypothetical protein
VIHQTLPIEKELTALLDEATKAYDLLGLEFAEAKFESYTSALFYAGYLSSDRYQALMEGFAKVSASSLERITAEPVEAFL